MRKLAIPVIGILAIALWGVSYYSTCIKQSAQDKNIAVVKRFLNEVVSGGNIDILPELWAPDMYWYNNGREVRGLDLFEKQLRDAIGKTFVDMRLTIIDVVSSGDKVVVRFKNSGRNAGALMGLPPTNKTASWDGIGIYRLKNGKIIEAWFAEDDLSMFSQLGIVSLPGNDK